MWRVFLDGTNIALALFLLYWLAVIGLERKGILKKYNISTYGPILMIRTTRGLNLLDKLAIPRKAWRIYADIGIRLMFVGMVAMFLVIILSDLAMLSSIGENSLPEPGKFNEARNIFLIPGVNEFIPLTWGIIALVVTLVVHEFSHAILCRVEDIRVKSMGILLAVVPIGGFAEPDEEELFGKKEEKLDEQNDPYGDRRLGITIGEEEKKTVKKSDEKIATRKQRARILAAGVMANFVVALIAFGLLFGPVLGAMAPLSDTVIVEVTESSPAYEAGIREDMIVTQIDDAKISSAYDMLDYLEGLEAGTKVTVYAASDQVISSYETEIVNTDITPSGIAIQSVVDNSPASEAGLETGMSILYIDGSPIRSYTDFHSIMNSTLPGQEVVVEATSEDSEGTSAYNVTLVKHPDVETKGFLGIVTNYDGQVATSLGISVGEFPATAYLDLFKSIPQMLMSLGGWLLLLGLPIIGFAGEGFLGFSGTLAPYYEPIGWAQPFGMGVFWLADALLWIGWLNFYVGLFNCLPAVPLDGGHVFRDYMNGFINKVVSDEEKAEHISALIAASFAMLILLSFLFMIFGPYIVHGF